MSTKNISFIENNVIISEEYEVAEIFNSYFSNAVKNLNIESYEHFSLTNIYSATILRMETQSKQLFWNIKNTQAY